ncbi:MAG TPA: homoserine kinase [Actinomycetota bacterium]
MADRVVVRAPATVANLGPGFDVMGLALTWHDEVRVERGGEGLEITASGLGADTLPRDETNGVVVGLRAVLGDLPALRIHKMTAVAYARGFGASALSICAGLVAGRALGDTAHSDDDLLALAVDLEGHPDNVAPCLRGGITVNAAGRGLRLDPPDQLCLLACIAPGALSTETARAALPDMVPHADAVANVGRAALLAAALATRRLDVLFEATEDVLHQPPRFALMRESGDLVAGLRAGGVAAFLSGAGPSVGAFVRAHEADAGAVAARALAPDGWEVRVIDIDRDGATVVESR